METLVENLEALERLAALKDAGALTESEFNLQKQRLLQRTGSAPSQHQRTAPLAESQERDVAQFQGSTIGWVFGSFNGWISLILCAVGIGFIFIFVKWIKDISNKYVLTSNRLIIRTGIIFKRVDEIELYRVKDVRVDYSLINQITDIGTISLRSSDTTTNAHYFVINDIPQARDVRELIRNYVDQARRIRQVREMDIDTLYA
jgi:uncharacterized membrane protein YdbT with pleckstrin-like domain